MDPVGFAVGLTIGLVLGVLVFLVARRDVGPGAPGPRLTGASWRRLREIVKRRDGATCQYCGQAAPDGQPDHVLPLAQGGRDSLDNLVWCCPVCNQSKQGRTLREWLQAQRPQPDAGDMVDIAEIPIGPAPYDGDGIIMIE